MLSCNVCVLILALINLYSCVYTTNSTCTVLKDINGCSTPLGLNIPHKTLFTPACNHHDVCYRCGEKYKWSQKECDIGFKKQMYKLCSKSQHSFQFTYSFGTWGSYVEFYKRIYQAWKKATANKSSKDEIKRLWKKAVLIFSMVLKWKGISDPIKKCEQGADIYYESVAAFGTYAFRTKSKPYCSEQCAKKLGNPY